VVTDPVKHLAAVTVDGKPHLTTTLVSGRPITVSSSHAHSAGAPPALSVVDETGDSPEPTLCQSLIK
jgi:hypothetical protein